VSHVSAARGVKITLRLVICLVGSMAVVMSGCGDDEPDRARSSDANPPFKARVEITKDGYRPQRVSILVGGQVTFVNVDKSAPHTAETGELPEHGSDSNEFDTHTLTWEEPYTITFHKPGQVEYHSSFDPEMTGIVDVLIRE
jgi:plastocyanin